MPNKPHRIQSLRKNTIWLVGQFIRCMHIVLQNYRTCLGTCVTHKKPSKNKLFFNCAWLPYKIWITRIKNIENISATTRKGTVLGVKQVKINIKVK